MPPMSVGWPNCVVCIHRVRAVSRSQPVVCHVRGLEETCCYACTQWLVSPGWSYSVGMKFVVSDCPFCNRPAHLDDPDHLQKIVTPNRSVLHQHNKGRLSIQFTNKNVSDCQTVLFATGRLIWMIQIICKKKTPMGHFLNRRFISNV